MILYEACKFLELLAEVPILILDNNEKTEWFCSTYQLHDSQIHITADRLNRILEKANPDEILCMIDIFSIYTIFVFLENSWIAIGPFCTETYSFSKCQLLLASNKVPQISADDLVWYRSQFSISSVEKMIHCARCLITQIAGETKIRNTQTMEFHSERKDADSSDYQHIPYGRIVEERYAIELRMMDHIRNGRADAAVNDWHILNRDVAFTKKSDNSMNVARISAAITRTTIRLAAMEAGLPPILIDKRTGESRDTVYKANNLAVIGNETEKLIRDLCNAIKTREKYHYSALIMRAVSILEGQYSEDITISGLADDLGVSTNHLINTFREECGMTPNKYLANVRIRQGMRLLANTNLPVQEISAMVGILDANYFARQFKKITGITPLQFRKTHQGEN